MQNRDDPRDRGSIVQRLRRISMIPGPGPAPAFTHVHVCRALLTIGDAGPIGRIELSRVLGLGEGAVRTIIKHVTNAGLVRTVKDGCILSPRGRLLYRRLREKLSKISPVDARGLSLDKFNAAILVKGMGRRLKRGIEQRDEAIKAGATGACTLVARRREFLMPMDRWRLRADDLLAQEINRLFNPEDGDVITIVGATTRELAEHGALAAALTLVE